MVLATQATVESHAYARACEARGLRGYEKACPILVPLVEEGWTGDGRSAKDSVALQVLRIYLEEAFAEAPGTRVLLLGCTHYPLIRLAIEQTISQMGYAIPVVDSAHATARAVSRMLGDKPDGGAATCEFFATDSVEKFARLGSRFLGLPVDRVDLVDLGG
jgi:glutamate racemase